MRDLDLWQALTGGDDAGDWLADLGELAELPLRARGPFVPLVAPLLGHRDPAVRALAARILSGVTGVRGLRALVGALDDDDDAVRLAAIGALRASAVAQPTRYAHAMFHHRDDVRRSSLASVPAGAAELACYLRTDAACRELAVAAPWPKNPLPLALDLYRRGGATAAELAVVIVLVPTAQLAQQLATELGREREVVDAYLSRTAAGAELQAPAGFDGLGTVFEIVAALGDGASNVVAQLTAALVTRKPNPLARRAAVELLARAARGPLRGPLLELLVALEPRVIGYRFFERDMIPAAAAALMRFRGANRPPIDQVHRLLAAPVLAAADGAPALELAAAVVWMLPARRLSTLEERFGADAIASALLGDDRGWDAIAALPPETEARDRAWLLAVGACDSERFCQLAGRALASFSGDPERCRDFTDWLPRAVRAPALMALAERLCAGELTLSAKRVANLAHIVGARLTPDDAALVLTTLCDEGVPARLVLALQLARSLPEKLLMAACTRITSARALGHLVAASTGEHRLPWARELAIARYLGEHADPALRAWAAAVRSAFRERRQRAAPARAGARALTASERDRIARAAIGNLAAALEPALSAPVTGLTAALAVRDAPTGPHLAACSALCAAGDPLAEVATELERFGADHDRFDQELDAAATRWLDRRDLSPLANARLYRWEYHKFALLDWVTACGGALPAFEIIGALPGRIARMSLWRAVSSGLLLLRYRDRPRLTRLLDPALGEYLAREVDQPWGQYAARALVTLVEAGNIQGELTRLRDIVLDRAADADAETRAYLRRLVRLDGVPRPAAVDRGHVAVDELATIGQCTDIDALIAACQKPRVLLVQEAVLRLLELGREDRLAALAGVLDTLPCPVPIIESIPLWSSEPALARVRALAGDGDLPPPVRFHLAVSLCERGERALVDVALDAAAVQCDESWLRRADWSKLCRVAEPLRCARALAASPHHHAYMPAVKLLCALDEPTGVDADAVRAFLAAGTQRPLELRRQAVRFLLARFDDARGLPILCEQTTDPEHTSRLEVHLLPRAEARRLCAHVAEMALVGGAGVCDEGRMLEVLALRPGGHDTDTWTAVLHGAATRKARQRAARILSGFDGAGTALRDVAEVFAWGVKRSAELTGKLYRIHMTSAERELGYTYLTENRVFVSPLPLLRGERYGRDVVEGLILHELGHHLYHRGDQAAAIWQRAADEGLQPLLNLVMDEHLERNLRAIDAGYGDRLKRLDAYGFQHAAQELPLADLLESLRGAAADALIAMPLEVAFEPASVRIHRGSVLAELARRGHPLARFARALRMGLGNREDDPIVTRALALFDKSFRQLDNPGLYRVTRELAEMFGGATSVARVFGGSEGLTWGERDADIHGGFDDDALQREVERILDPRQQRSSSAGAGRGRLAINVSAETRFDPITHVERVRGDREAYRAIAARVKRHAHRLRSFLDELGLRWLPVGARVQGRSLDRARLRPLVIRRDPRILVARQPRRYSDLFIGVAVDCSGSMTVGDNIDRAKQFAVLLTEATRPLHGVDVRLFGFTDRVIYDAGSQHDCDVTALEAGGGNNDAAALLHLAQTAARSPRRAKVLVMISDGLPTECSVEALRALVEELSRRRRMLCAQVAVRPLEEVCFPHYVLIEDTATEVSVARFGRMIAELARRSLAAG